MKTHHCRECGARVAEFCAKHPKAIVDTIISRSGPNLTDAQRAKLGYGRLTLRLPVHALAQLADLAHERGVTRAQLVAELTERASNKAGKP